MAKLVRILLINIVFAELGVASFFGALSISGLILDFSSLSPPDLWFSRFLIWGYYLGAIARQYSLAGFSLVGLIIVRYNQKDLKTWTIILFLIIIWSVSVLLSIRMLSSPVQFYDNVACFSRPLKFNAGPGIAEHNIVTAGWIIFGGLIPLVFSIVVPIVPLCCRQKSTVSPGSPYNKGIAKFSLFLVAGNFINMIGDVLILFFQHSTESSGVYVAFCSGLISLIPTPIMILAFLKPVCCKLQETLCCIKFQYSPPESGLPGATERSMSVVVKP